VRRFLRVPGQTLVTPIVTTALYFVVFGWSLGSRLREIEGVPYARFIVPGLVTLGVVTNAYANTSSSLFVMKLQGTIVDLLVSPLAYGEILTAFVAAAVVRGLLVGGAMWAVAGAFGGFDLAHPMVAIVLVTLAAISFAALGLVSAIWASTFEQVNFFPTFFITPLTFLGGVFYSVEMLPPALRRFTLANPVFYMVDGVRFRDARYLGRDAMGRARRSWPRSQPARSERRGAPLGLQAAWLKTSWLHPREPCRVSATVSPTATGARPRIEGAPARRRRSGRRPRTGGVLRTHRWRGSDHRSPTAPTTVPAGFACVWTFPQASTWLRPVTVPPMMPPMIAPCDRSAADRPAGA
jgi:ABC-2 type transport system permease protein